MLHITSTENGEAAWWVEHDQLWMESFTDYALRDRCPSYRMKMDGSVIENPEGTPGVLYFGDGYERPPLTWVEQRLPIHRELWIAVEAAYWDVVQPLGHDESRLNNLRPSIDALDYQTDQWTIGEIRKMAS